MQIEFGNKQQIENHHLQRRVNNEGRLIGSRVRHITWLHTYHVKGILTHYQFHAGYKLGYLWNRVVGQARFTISRYSDLPRGITAEFGESELPTMLREAISAIGLNKEKEAAIDLSVFDMAMSKRINDAKHGLNAVAAYFKEERKKNV